ncbi:ATP-binding protein [Paenibacillus abyssi]|uniref:histidine kinase n=1 Tax=Paenibacillus abyssi TaxID=1340531 RepID=A0A917G645_9BACL|nr:ATP-binding protein [Paenibacillus abyssi]GGG25017.1 hypothetical protein GCM10010916_46910 [Paenibacillus abyssi]
MYCEPSEHVIFVRDDALETLLNTLPYTMMILMDSDLVIERSNDLFLRQTGFVGKDIAGKSMYEIIEQLEERATSKVKERRRPAAVRVRKANGGNLEADLAMMKFMNESSEMRRLALLHRTDPLETGDLLQQFALMILRDESLGVILLQPDFRVSDMSPLACRVLGVRCQDVVGRTMEELFLRAPLEHQLLKQMVVEEIPVRNHPLQWASGDERRELLMDANLLKDEQNQLLGAYVIFKDVSDLRSLEAQVQRSDRLAMIGQIAAGTAHEIRNPLTAIKGFLQMFKSTLLEKGLDKEFGYTEIMLNEIERINNLVSEFLLLSKPKDVNFDIVELSMVLKEIMPIVSNEALLHGIVVQFDPDASLPRVVADREMLKQVFLNICKNGIEAMSEGGVLTVSGKIERVNGFVRWINIDIHDTGPGIPPGIIDKIFDPFVTTKQNGTGLGLSVCQRIIHEMGGVIRVSTKGIGTIFTVSIPCSIEERARNTAD